MNRRNWLDLSRKLVDQYDLDYTVSAVETALDEAALSYWGEGVLITTTYPQPFPVTLSALVLGGTVGNGIAFDLNGRTTRIDPASPTAKTFVDAPADTVHARWDLLVMSYVQAGDTPVPKPSDPITTIFLNLHDDFVISVVEGTPSATPVYPAKTAGSIILAGLRVPANATLGTQITVDYMVREMAVAGIVQRPVFVQEIPTGVVNGTNHQFVLSQFPMNIQSLLILVDDLVLTLSEFSLINQTVTITNAPAPGQSVYAYYVANSPASLNPLAGFQETPSGTVNGTNPIFTLSGRPVDQASTLVFVDGGVVDRASWDLVQSLTTSEIQFHGGSIPASGQSVYVWYLVNAVPFGGGGSGGGGGGGNAPETHGSFGAPVLIDPTVGIMPTTALDQTWWIVPNSPGAGQLITAVPQIAAGTTIGQKLKLKGGVGSDYFRLVDAPANGVSQDGPCDLTNAQTIEYAWDGSTWSEDFRRI